MLIFALNMLFFSQFQLPSNDKLLIWTKWSQPNETIKSSENRLIQIQRTNLSNCNENIIESRFTSVDKWTKRQPLQQDIRNVFILFQVHSNYIRNNVQFNETIPLPYRMEKCPKLRLASSIIKLPNATSVHTVDCLQLDTAGNCLTLVYISMAIM